ncbi:small-conductance mechanosensitive channel [Biostraticola tofi]|uniref:Small-conductance mechanosensitive channel n=2 Tax=Biostraticola tofi TaxID=466109 RepID=A0A4R3YZU6_9GAMM|nr:mechanosensitive channel protein [Biostraticola tofi]TCV98082.1 small-conductance mechanosensitive channel [Biostraticola tofi]
MPLYSGLSVTRLHLMHLRNIVLLLLIPFVLLPRAMAASDPAGVNPSQAVASAHTQGKQEEQEKPGEEAEQQASYAALANILDDENSRADLIQQLRAAADGKQSDVTPQLAPGSDSQDDPPTLLDSITGVTRHYSGVVSNKLAVLHNTLTHAPQHRFNQGVFLQALSRFALLSGATFAFYFAARLVIAPLLRRVGHWGRKTHERYKSGVKAVLVLLGAFAAELGLLLAAVMVGQLLGQYLSDGSRVLARQQALFLNAFALMEFFKLLLRMIFCPGYPEIRRFPIGDQGARYWNNRLSLVSGFIGYSSMVVVPIIANQTSLQIAAVVNFMLMLGTTLYILLLIVRNKRVLQQELERLANRSLAFFSVFIRAFSLVWHWLAITYFVVLFFLTQFDPGNSLKFMVTATVKSLMMISIGALLSGLLTRWISRHISLSADMRRNYPQLQQRINVYVSGGLKICRILVVCSVILMLLDAWHLFDLGHWLTDDVGARMVDALLRIAIIMFFSVLGWTLLASLIENRLATDAHGRPQPSARTRTLLTLFRNALSVIISTITIMIILSEIGVNIAPLLAGAGALGLAVSFGSQTLVKDVITGVFIQFENGMNTGDLVTIGDVTGVVERMTIRSVGVRQDTGAYHIIPYSSITTFANFVRGIGSFVANYDVSRNENIDKVNTILREAVSELMQKPDIGPLVIGEPNFGGVVGLTNQAFTVRVSFTTQALKQWTVRFALDGLVKNHFEAAGIKPPYQAVQVINNSDAPDADPSSAAGSHILPSS